MFYIFFVKFRMRIYTHADYVIEKGHKLKKKQTMGER